MIVPGLIDASRAADPLEADRHWLAGNTFAKIIVESDTVASTLISIFYHLVQDPGQNIKLRNELDNCSSISNTKELKAMDHLDRIINEALRSHLGLPSRGFRQIPAEGLTIAGQYIPGGLDPATDELETSCLKGGIPSPPSTAGLVVTAVMAVVPGGGGQHEQNVDPAGLPSVLQGYIAADILWVIADTLIKISILHLYIQIFSMRGFRKVTYTIMVVVIGFAAVLDISIVNVIIDITIIALPMPVLWRLQMATKRKVAIAAIFGLGSMWNMHHHHPPIVAAVQFDINDFTYGLAELAIWTDLEPTIGTVNACLPVVQPALRRMFGMEKRQTKSVPTSGGARFEEGSGAARFFYALTNGLTTQTLVGTSSLPG
ncbi:hypothetical protein MMC34_002948 [Xylographa carneopallida]|nr:hypothetical protein [Xylographa carneopallida]